MSNLTIFNQTLTAPKTQAYLESVLADKKASFVNNLTALVANNANLQACEPITLMYAGIKATALDLPLDPNLGFAYVIPFKNNKVGKTEAQFQLGYRGYIQLAIRSGQFKTLNVTDIREGEMRTCNLLTGEIEFNAQPDRERLQIVGYAAYFRLTNGFEKTLYITKGEMEAHAKRYSQTYSARNEYVAKNSKWATDFDAMAKKTAIKLLLSKFAPLSIDMQNAVKADQAVIDGENSYRYADNQSVDEVVTEEIAENANQTTITIDLGASDGDKSTTTTIDTETGEIVKQKQTEVPQQGEANLPGF